MKNGMKIIASTLIGGIVGSVIGSIAIKRVYKKSVKGVQTLSDKHLSLFLLMNQWVEVKQAGKSLVSYFEEKGYKTIAIYGMSYAGERLLDELKGSSIIVKYGIDKEADALYSDIDIVRVEEELVSVDAIIVTPVFFFEEIKNTLSNKVECPIISLEDILYEV